MLKAPFKYIINIIETYSTGDVSQFTGTYISEVEAFEAWEDLKSYPRGSDTCTSVVATFKDSRYRVIDSFKLPLPVTLTKITK